MLASKGSLKSFPRFSRLPLELRLVIWQLTLPGPRLVKVHYNIQNDHFHSTTPIPTILHTCHESRAEAKNWQLHFHTLGHPARIYANLDIDTIELDWDLIRLQKIPSAELRNIKSLELGGVALQSVPPDTLLAQLLSFRNLEQLSLVSPPPDPLCARYYSSEYSHFRDISGENEMSSSIKKELSIHHERRHLAFSQHALLTRAMFMLKEVSWRWKMPTLCLIVATVTGGRIGPYVWVRTGLPESYANLEFFGVGEDGL